MDSKITLAELIDLVETNSFYLVGGTVEVIDSKTISFTVKEFSYFDIVATILDDGRILDTVEDLGKTIYTTEEYKQFLKCEDDSFDLGEVVND